MHYEMCGTYLETRANTYYKEMPLPKTCRDKNLDGRNLVQLDDGYVDQIANPKVDKHIFN